MSFNGSCWNKNRSLDIPLGWYLALMVFYVYAVLCEVYYITSRSYLLIAIFAIRRTQLFHQRWMILTARTSIFNRNSSRSNIWFAATCMGFGKHKPNHAVGLGCRASFISRSLSSIWYFMLCIPPLITLYSACPPRGLYIDAPHPASILADHPLKLYALPKSSKFNTENQPCPWTSAFIQQTQMRRRIMHQWGKRWESIQQHHTWQQSTCKKRCVR